MALAIFDLDDTLIAADSDHLWGEFVVERGLVDAASHRAKNDASYEQYRRGELDIDDYLRFSCSVLAGRPLDELCACRAEFMQEKIRPIVPDKARALVESHRSSGDTLLVITATIEFITRPIVDEFGIETLIAPVPELLDGRYTGRVIGTPSFAAGKVTRLEEWLEGKPHTLAGSHFYSDSHNDLPLLELVEHPVAVDPDPRLQAEALARGWRIMSLRG